MLNLIMFKVPGTEGAESVICKKDSKSALEAINGLDGSVKVKELFFRYIDDNMLMELKNKELTVQALRQIIQLTVPENKLPCLKVREIWLLASAVG